MQRLPIAIAVLAALFGTSAFAADMAVKMPIKVPPPVVAPNPWYGFIDGMYEGVSLPSYGLGLHSTTFPGLTDNGPINRFRVRLNGAGVRGGIGYSVPGTQWRLEASASYIQADGSTSNTSSIPGTAVVAVFLNGGIGPAAFLCSPFHCSGTGQLNSHYDSWQAVGKAAYDLRWGSATLSPFAALFGGSSKNDQTLNQSFLQVGPIIDTGTFSTNTALTWNDVGGRVGFDAVTPLADWISWNLTTWAGVAGRRIDLNGSDSGSDTPFAILNGTSAITTSTTTTAFVANAETGFSITPMPAVTLRVFGGINFDNRIPGLSAPAFAGAVGLPTGGTPVAVTFSSETNYYAGGGAFVKF